MAVEELNTDPNSSKPLRFAVIGGGISGLTAAYRLTQLAPEAEIELFEAGPGLGGVLSTQVTDPYLMELGADSFINKLPAAVELCHELGLEDRIIPTNLERRRALVLAGGKLHPVPAGFVQMRPQRISSMLTTPILSWKGKLRLLAERWISKASGLENSDYDESVASFATRRLGREVCERLVQPLLAGIYVADARKLSVAATMETAITAEREHGSLQKAVLAAQSAESTSSNASGARYGSFVTLKGGLAELVQTLAKQLQTATIHLNSPIESVTRGTSHRWSIRTLSGEFKEGFDGVVTALPAPRTADALQELDEELSQDLRSIPYASSAVVVFAYRREQIREPLEAFGIVVPEVEGRRIVAASFSSLKFPGRAPDDEVLIRVFLGGALQSELLDLTDEELIGVAQEEVTEILDISGSPLRSELVRWQEKMPQYHVGHLQIVSRIENRVAAIRGLELAGNAYRGVGIPQCVKSGDSAARRLVEDLRGETEINRPASN